MPDDVLELLDTAPAPAMSIDPYAAVEGGRRRIRRRRAGVGSGIATAALVVGLTAWTATRPDDVPGVPAGSLPSSTVTVPASVVSAAATISPDGYLTETLFDQIRLRVEVKGGLQTATWLSGTRVLAESTGTLRDGVAQATVVKDGSVNYVLGRIKGDVQVMPSQSLDPGSGVIQSGERVVPEHGETAFWFRADDQRDLAGLVGFTWQDSNGVHGASLLPASAGSGLLRTLVHTPGGNTGIAWAQGDTIGWASGTTRHHQSVAKAPVQAAPMPSNVVGNRRVVIGWVDGNADVRVTTRGSTFIVSMSDLVNGRRAFIASSTDQAVGDVTVQAGSHVTVLPQSHFTR